MSAHQNAYDPMAMSIDSDSLKQDHAPVHPAHQDEDKTQAEEKVYLDSEFWHREGVGWSECTIILHHSKKTTTRVTETSTKDGKFQITIEAVEISRSDAS